MLSVSWQVDQVRNPRALELDWRERAGPAVTVPKRTGFGHVVMKKMVEQAVQGRVEINFAGERPALVAAGSRNCFSITISYGYAPLLTGAGAEFPASGIIRGTGVPGLR